MFEHVSAVFNWDALIHGGELATFLATELHITKVNDREAICVVGEAADSLKLGMLMDWLKLTGERA